MTRTVREMLYEGWSLQPYVEIIEMLAEAAGITIPPGLIPEDPRFGFFYGVSQFDSETIRYGISI